jgi:hypothetical protein
MFPISVFSFIGKLFKFKRSVRITDSRWEE